MNTNRRWFTVAGVFLVVILLVGACSAGFVAGWMFSPKAQSQSNAPLPVSEGKAVTTSTDELFKPFWEGWQYVHDYYVDQPVDDEKLMQGAIKGMLEALGDEHTSYMDPQQYQDAQMDLTGEYEGIGAWVNTDGDYLTIAEPMKGSPAEEAGLLPGDQIIAVDGEDMTGILPELARQRVLGPAGSSVALTILREGVEEPFDVTVRRAAIKVTSVEGEMLEGNIAYIRLRSFSNDTDQELHNILKELMKNEPVGLILDLRNNPGGGLITAVNVASEFVKEGVILYEVYGDGSRETHNANGRGLATEIPLIVLVNEYSASASEVLAGAIRDHDRGILVGVTTFGKGSVQQWLPLSNEQGAVRVTIARWLTPKEHNIHKEGLKPDVEVERTDEDYKAKRDPQLDKAIEIFKQK